MAEPESLFARWLNTVMQSHSLSQADVARTLGVADTQVSRWRRGQVVPSVRYLQQIADVFGVPRTTLDRLAGYPVSELPAPLLRASRDPAEDAALQAYQARLAQLLAERVPPSLRGAYVTSCEALAEGLARCFGEPEADPAPSKSNRPMGFQPHVPGRDARH